MNFDFTKLFRYYYRLIRIFLKNQKILFVVKKVVKKGLTYLDKYALLDLIESLFRINKTKTDGIWVEAGTALGGSAIVIATLKSKNNRLLLFDTFSQIPEPTDWDGKDVQERYKLIKEGKATGIKSNPYYGYIENLLLKVINTFKEFGLNPIANNIFFIQGLFEETMIINEPVSFAHIDCDWYESVKYCLNQIIPNLQIGGLVIIDDYYHWSGCKLAVDEFINSYDKNNQLKISQKSRLHIERIS